MKKALITVGTLAIVASFAYAAMVTNIFNAKVFTTSESAGKDTSSTYTLNYYDNVNLVTTATGTDSIKIWIDVDGYANGKWELGVIKDTLSKLGTTGSHANTTELRGVSVGLGGYEAFRVRNAITSYADSSSALSYSQWIVAR